MHFWHLTRDATGTPLHETKPGALHALLSPLLAQAFAEIDVSASVWEHGVEWIAIHNKVGVSEFEVEHGADKERNSYNEQKLSLVLAKRRPVRGEHAGFHDYFVPISVQGKVVAILVVGPFALKRPTSTEVLERWRQITGREGHVADPEFAAYLAATFATLVVEGDRRATLERMALAMARLMSGEGAADESANRIEKLRKELHLARFAERSWELAERIVDDRARRTSYSEGLGNELKRVGLRRRVDHVLVGLVTSRKQDSDRVAEAIRYDAFQRSSAELARGMQDVIAGRVGEHGVVFMSGAPGALGRKRQKLLDIADKAAALARQRFGFGVHFGACSIGSSAEFSRSYQSALAAAESALVQDTRLVFAEPSTQRSAHSLRHLRSTLIGDVEQRPELLGVRFERYAGLVASHCGHRLEPVRAHLELGFDQLAENLAKRGVIEAKSLTSMQADLDRAAGSARTLGELFDVYRKGVDDVRAIVRDPGVARQNRSLQSALEHIREHYAEPLRRNDVARIAGFAPSHFSRLFKSRQGVTFETYLGHLRIERAKQLLGDTDLEVTRIAALCGFKYAPYFARAFRRWVREAPLEYRKRTQKAAKKARQEHATPRSKVSAKRS